MLKIAIVIIAYNRVDSLRNLLNSINNAFYLEVQVPLIISIDKSDKSEVEDFADDFVWKNGEKRVIKHKVNLGLRKHVLECGNLLEEFDALIVLEDDLIVAPNFYFYSVASIEQYFNNPEIAGISLYNFQINYLTITPFYPIKNEFDAYFINCAQSWGQIWMKNQWNDFISWYNVNNDEFVELNHLPKSLSSWPPSSWLKYHTRYCIERNKYFVYPYTSLTTNNGEEGTHNAQLSSLFQVRLQKGRKQIYKLPDLDNNAIYYDGFFENKGIAQFISNCFNISKNEICVDLNGEKRNRENKRYWLTTQAARFKILKQFGLRYKPVEENIYNITTGNEIFLYDCSVKHKKPKSKTPSVINYQFDIDDMNFFIRKYGLLNLLATFITKLKQRISR